MVFYGELAERLVLHFFIAITGGIDCYPHQSFISSTGNGKDRLSDIPQSVGNCSILTGLCVRK